LQVLVPVFAKMKNSDQCRSHCPINFFTEAFGDPWSLLVVRDLMFNGKRSYGEFLSSNEGVSTNILADRLKRLEANGIVEKSVDPKNRSKFVYTLTEKGRDLGPIMLEITAWSARHDASTNAPKDFLARLRKARDLMVDTIRKGVVKK
jgi:DNA-binding HxlR family transcriptional regulator